MTEHEFESHQAATLDGLVSEAQIDALESGQLQARGPVSFQGSVDPNLDLTFIDPRQMVEVVVKPGRAFSQVLDQLPPGASSHYRTEMGRDGAVSAHYLPGKVYKVARQTLENNRGVLCTPAEYRQIQELSKTAQAQKVQRDIEEMRAYQVQISNEKQPVAAKTREEELRRAAADHATKYEQQRAEAQQVATTASEQRQREAAQRQTVELAQMSAEQFEDHLATKRARTQHFAETLGSRGREAVLATIEQDENDLRQKWQNAQMSRGLKRETQTEAGPDQRVQRLRVLRDSGVITQDDFDRQLAKLVAE